MLKPFYQKKLETLIIDYKAFEECIPPKIGTSGMPLFYYISTEKLLNDQNKWQEFGDDSALMIKHALNCYKTPPFKDLALILAEYSHKYIKTKNHQIAGFQRRDWVFSGVCSFLNNKDHFSFYKNNRIEILDHKANLKKTLTNIRHKKIQKIVFIGDLLNIGHTAINGWLPMLNAGNYQCRDAVYVFSRNQGGEKNLRAHHIKSHSLIRLGTKFLERHCKHKNFCVSYWRNPLATSAMYLRKNGATAFLPYFNPDLPVSNRPRVINFYQNWVLKTLSNAQLTLLKEMVKSEFGVPINSVLDNFSHTTT